MIQLHVIVSGRVQGVGFRATVKRLAQSMGLRGTVRNLPDGKVEIFAQGHQQQIDSFLNNLKEHNRQALVDKIETRIIASSKEYSDFEII